MPVARSSRHLRKNTDRGLNDEAVDLRRQVEERDRLLEQLRQTVQKLEALQVQRDEQLEDALCELSAASSVAGLTGAQASQRLEYIQLLRRIREVVRERLPRGATIAVASKGHDDMLRLSGRSGWHFPQNREGVYAGYYPSNSQSAIVQLEALRSRGAQYFLLPQFALWWLERYEAFARHLQTRYEVISRDEETCVIFNLTSPIPRPVAEELLDEMRERLGREPSLLDWGTKADLAAKLPDCAAFPPAEEKPPLPYLDGSIDIVAIGSKSRNLKEARRLAREAVLQFADKGTTATVAWRAEAARPAAAVSIVIPCHNGMALTNSCLRSVLETLPASFRGEMIVVDDASTDGTKDALLDWARRDRRVKPLRNARNLGFLGTAQRGAEAATGEFIVFLNNDVVLLPGWLPPLLRTFRDFPDAGGVGGKLIFPDGTLQEAGGMLFGDGSAAHYGRGDHQLDAPHYNFVRETDYCSAALFATPRALFKELGGFDRAYAPAYYEDTDYCCAVRTAGRRIYYQPECAAIHIEGATCGTDLSTGAKQHQVLNQKRFARKWRRLLRKLPARPDHGDAEAWRALALRGAGEIEV